jgi:hypothetical protein
MRFLILSSKIKAKWELSYNYLCFERKLTGRFFRFTQLPNFWQPVVTNSVSKTYLLIGFKRNNLFGSKVIMSYSSCVGKLNKEKHSMAKPNYSFEKRKKELDRQKKKDEKKARKSEHPEEGAEPEDVREAGETSPTAE